MSRGSAERGDEYFLRGRVKRVEAIGNAIEADVQGSRLYSVDLVIDNEMVDVSCDCPWYVQNSEVCKHIWAAIRAASARNLLPDRRLGIFIDDSLQRLNAAKNVLAALVNGIAALLFIVFADVDWAVAGLLGAGAIVGGQVGATAGRRISPRWLRAVIVSVGVAVAIRLLFR